MIGAVAAAAAGVVIGQAMKGGGTRYIPRLSDTAASTTNATNNNTNADSNPPFSSSITNSPRLNRADIKITLLPTKKKDHKSDKKPTVAAAILRGYESQKVNTLIYLRTEMEATRLEMTRAKVLKYVEDNTRLDKKRQALVYNPWAAAAQQQQQQDEENADSENDDKQQQLELANFPVARRMSRKSGGRDDGEAFRWSSGDGTARSHRRGKEQLHQLPLRAQDVHALDVVAADTVKPFITVRRQCILFRVGPFRAIILRDRLILIVGAGIDPEKNVDFILLNRSYQRQFAQVNPFEEENAFQGGDDFEWKALKLLLDCILLKTVNTCDVLKPKISLLLKRIESSVTLAVTAELDELKKLKDDANRLENLLEKVTQALTDVMVDDSALIYMNLTRMTEQPDLFWNPNDPRNQALCEESSAFFEAFWQDISEVAASMKQVADDINNTEGTLQLQFDMSQNRIIAYNNIFTVVGLVFGFGSCICGIFGMNFKNGREGYHYWFIGTTFILLGVMFSLFFWLIWILYKAGLFLV